MAALSAKKRKRLPKRSFALPGKRAYPIDSKARARNALARAAQHASPAQRKKIQRAVRRRYPSIKVAGRKTRRRKR